MNKRLWVWGATGLVLAGVLCLVTPRLGGIALILLALAAVAIFAYRIL